jgi:hypothetical protein
MEARLVKLEGVAVPCLLVHTTGHPVPEEIVVDLDSLADRLEVERRGAVTWRLLPSSASDSQPVYVEVFDE